MFCPHDAREQARSGRPLTARDLGPSAVVRLAVVATVLAASVPVLAAAPARAQSVGSYTECEPTGAASIVSVSGASCDDARAVATALLAQPADQAPAVLSAAGWAPLRAQDTDDRGEHDVVATRAGGPALRVRRPGAAPDLDGWSAGRELIFSRRRIVGGAPIPRDASLCTSAFLVRVRGGGLGGLSAAHCGGLRRNRTVQRHNSALRRPPAPGIVLGRVQRILTRSRPLDALVLPIPSGPTRTRAAVVDRGVSNPPWAVAASARPNAGRRVCYTGRTSGVDRCGRIAGRSARGAERFLRIRARVSVRCTTIRAAQGDSGGPVYTAPRADGTVRAIGIVTLVVGPGARMCFTPLSPVLRGLRARLVTAAG